MERNMLIGAMLLLAFFLLGAVSQHNPYASITLRDANNQVMGYIKNEKVYDKNNNLIGYVKDNGTYDSHNKKVAASKLPGLLFCK